MSEDLGADLKVTECVSILEETLCIKSVLSDNFTEVLNNLLAKISLALIGLTSTIDGLGAYFTDSNIKVLLKTLLGEDFIDFIRELSPHNVLTFLWCLEYSLEHIKLTLRNGALGHGKSNSELLGSNVTGSQSVEITEELRDADTLLLGKKTDTGNNILLIIRCVTNDLGLTSASLSLGEVVGAMVEALADTEKLLSSVDILTEVDIVDLINIALVHVAAEDGLKDVLGCTNSEQIKNA